MIGDQTATSLYSYSVYADPINGSKEALIAAFCLNMESFWKPIDCVAG